MVFTEFRIPLPMTVEEFQRAQLYMVLKASQDNTGDGEGVVWIKNEPYDNTDGKMGMAEFSEIPVPKNKGQYTLKHYHLASKIPWAVRKMLPESSMMMVEEAWNAYPHCVTVITNGYLAKEKFKIIIESMHLPDSGTTENALNLEKDRLKKRKVEKLDILDIPEDTGDYKGEIDASKFKSKKTGRGLLKKGWQKEADPVMCCYKLVTANFKYWGLQGTVEGKIENQDRELFTMSLAQAFCLIDEWFDLSIADIRKLEKESQAAINKALGIEVTADGAVDDSAVAEADAKAAADGDGDASATAEVAGGAGAGGGAGATDAAAGSS